MAVRSSLAVLLLAFGALFSLLYYAEAVDANIILTRPRITEEQATAIIDETLKSRLANYTGFGVFMGGMDYRDYHEFHARGAHVPLTFMHRNSTLLYVNSTTYEVYGKCTNTALILCARTPAYADETRGRLAYDFYIVTRTSGGNCDGSDFFVIDAMNGAVLFSFITEHPEVLQRGCLVAQGR